MYPILCIVIKWSKTTSLPTGFTEQKPVNSVLGGDRLLFLHPGASSTGPRWAEDRPYPLQCWMASLCFPFCLVFSIWLLAGYYACKSNNFKEKQKQVNGSTALLSTTSTTAPSPLPTDPLLFFPPPSPRNNNDIIYKTASTVSSFKAFQVSFLTLGGGGGDVR